MKCAGDAICGIAAIPDFASDAPIRIGGLEDDAGFLQVSDVFATKASKIAQDWVHALSLVKATEICVVFGESIAFLVAEIRTILIAAENAVADVPDVFECFAANFDAFGARVVVKIDDAGGNV